MFIRPTEEELASFEPDFVVLNGSKCTNPQWKDVITSYSIHYTKLYE